LNKENPLSFSISTKKSPLFVQIVILIFMIMSASFPIIGLIINFVTKSQLKFGLILSFILFGGISIYLFRIFCWNKFGKEIYEFDKKELKYYADYRYFKDGRKSIDFKDLKIKVNEFKDLNDEYGQLEIYNDNEKIESCVKTSLIELIDLKDRLKNYTQQCT
jgi:hypothetical protein